MERQDFISRYSSLGERIRKWLAGTVQWPEMEEAVALSAGENAFFTPWMQRKALEALAEGMLVRETLCRWLEKYPEPHKGTHRKVCGIVAAGNIPAVAFHDILTALAAGFRPLVKLSSKDRHLLPVLFPPDTGVEFRTSTDGWQTDALLTMGGDDAADFFRERFKGIPQIIRSGRFSMAILSGDEGDAELKALSEDMLLYFGLGCRSATCILVPQGYDFHRLKEAAGDFAARHWGQPGRNCHRRNRAELTLAGERFMDSGTVIFRDITAGGQDMGQCRVWGRNLRIGEVWYAEYSSQEDVQKFIEANVDRIQKIIRNFGSAQRPLPDDWPDGVDALGMLMQIQFQSHDTQI